MIKYTQNRHVNTPSSSRKSRANASSSLEVGRRALTLASQALQGAASTLGDSFEEALGALAGAKGNVVVTGVGKSAHIAAKIAATLNSTGTRSLFLHAGEALHGDVGAVNAEDVILCLSKSGGSEEVIQLLPTLTNRGCRIVAMTARPDSSLGKAADVVLDVTVEEEACPFDLAPTTSTSLQLALGDALAMALMARNGFQPDDFAKNHPAGTLGKALTWTLAQLVDSDRMPAVREDDDVPTLLKVMSEGRYGATLVWHAGTDHQLAGIVTDGDLRRAMVKGSLEGKCAGELACPSPKVLPSTTLATEAAQWMQAQGISQVIVMDGETYLGMVHIHDCLREGLI
ncbi:MAG: KpsF/GutQ family sugar-phosphate isomerase [Bacteroidota bacterium]|nr:KpsF/GutQ family sugar-phosphate isomerase [Flavobacteriales bacterium]MEC7476803.1 KpsF/GutQ family sugar-phosphate isomerase [Bacteroidota bacterium]MEC8400420.1 KpsF/GutQ family sugar-phosphate isomerase [Bacteroidota bacterium]